MTRTVNPYEVSRSTCSTSAALNPRKLFGLRKLVRLLVYGYVALVAGFAFIFVASAYQEHLCQEYKQRVFHEEYSRASEATPTPP